MAGSNGRLVPGVFLVLLVLHGTVSAQTLRDDEQHLFAFLQNVLPSFPSPFNLTVPTCQWQGVSCIGLGPQQRFYRLSFSGLGLNGTIPYLSLGSLTALSILDLSNNFLTGNIPYDIFTLPNLMQLELSNNNLNGSLPPWLNLFQLQRLNLSGNRLNGSIPDTFGFNLKSLKYINLHGNNFSGPVPVLYNSKFLNYLDVSSNQFTGGVPFGMFLITELVFLNASRNLLSGPIPAEFNWLWKMRVLDLSDNKFAGAIPDLYNLGQLTGLDVSSNGLNGSLPSNMTRLPNLQTLDVHNNFLTGSLPSMVSPIRYLDCRNNYFNGSLPLGFLASENLAVIRLGRNELTGPLPTNLTIRIQELDLTSNQFNGSIPWSSISNLTALKRLSLAQNWFAKATLPSFSQVVNLTFLNLSSCNVYGSIPDSVGDLQRLLQLDLSHNQVTGNIPSNFSRTINMTSLDLSHNNLTGEIPPELASLPKLSRVDLSFNNLSGEVPFENQWKFFTNSSFEGNALLCGIVLNKVCQKSVAPSPSKSPIPAPFIASETPVIVPPVRPRHDSSAVGAGTVVGIVVGLALALCAFLVTYFVFHRRHKYKKKARSRTRTRKENAIYLTGSVTFEADPCAWASQVQQPASIPVIMFEKPLLNLTFADLFQATSKFHKDSQIADGRYGPSFKGVLPGGFQIVVKVLYDGGPANELEKAAQLEALGKIRHENLVSLVGYCLVGEERLLVYEFMENGDVHQRLHDSFEETHHPDNWTKETWADASEKFPVSEDLSWPIRHRVAVGVARALAFLHHGCVPNVVHRDVTSANIMLDAHYEPHISDCGLAELVEPGKCYETTPVTGGTLGYVPPEYSRLCKATARGDVYSFGVVLLELVTGKRPNGEYYHESYGGNLVGWVRTLIRDKRGFKCLDPKLLSSGVESEMLEALRIGYLCTAELPSKRPTMQQVVGLLKDIHVDVVTCM